MDTHVIIIIIKSESITKIKDNFHQYGVVMILVNPRYSAEQYCIASHKTMLLIKLIGEIHVRCLLGLL